MSGVRLNDAQKRAIEYDHGPLIVLAGPGTGKTFVIIRRIAHMIGRRDIDPARICAMTFTNKAAEELRSRIADFVTGSAAGAVHAGTFHSFGLQMLRRFADLTGLPPELQLLDSAQQRRMLRSLIIEHGLFRRAVAAGIDAILADATAAIADFRNAGMEPAACEQRLETLLARNDLDAGQKAEIERYVDHVRLYGLFEKSCRAHSTLTVDELITLPTKLLREHAAVRDICRYDYRHVVVDEFQDLNRSQIELLWQLSGPGTPDLCVVGDDDQAIYAFRGADVFAFHHFKQHWPNAETVHLTENWRSGQRVLDLANQIISQNESRFAADKIIEMPLDRQTQPASIEAVCLENENDAGEIIAAMILLDRRANPERDWSSYAVLARTNTEVDRIASTLELEGVPAITTRKPDVRSDPGVQDLNAWINLILEPEQTWAARRILTRPSFGVSALAVSRAERSYRAELSRLPEGRSMPPLPDWLVERHAADEELGPAARRLLDLIQSFRRSAQTEAADATVHRIIVEAGLINADLPDGRSRAARIEALVTVLKFIRDRLPRLEQPRDLAAYARYYDDLDRKEQGYIARVDDLVDGPEDAATSEGLGVRVLTAHAAKGLEFDTVFLPKCSPPTGYPMTRSTNGPCTPPLLTSDASPPAVLEEERRLFYVACTRAKRRLVMLAKVPKKAGPTNLLYPLIRDGFASCTEADAVLAQAAVAGVGRVADPSDRSELDRSTELDRRNLLADVRRRIRRDAALALDAADRAPFDANRLQRASQSLHSAAEHLACVAAVESGAGLPTALSEQARRFAQDLRHRLAQESQPARGMTFHGQTPPLQLSFTAISVYLSCPRCYYVRYVLGLPDPVGPSVRLGSVVHRTLQRFCEKWRDADAEGSPPPELAHLLALGKRIFETEDAPGEPLDPAELEQILGQLRLYFEKLHAPDAEPIEIEKKLVFCYEHAGVAHQMTARIDRIDRTPEGIRIIDYKTGRPKKDLLEPRADDLQLGIYALAAEHFFQDDNLAGTAEYWLLSEGSRGVIALKDIDRDAIRDNIARAITGMLEGDFATRGKNCYESCNILASMFD